MAKVKTKTTTKPVDILQPKPDQPVVPVDKPKTSQPSKPTIRTADPSKTRQKTSQIQPNDQMRNLLNRMADIDADPDDPGYPENDQTEPVTPENLPAVINNSMIEAGYQNPEWHTVANLPGNMSQGIRTLGRRLFSSMTRTPTKDIVMIGNIMNMGPNTSQEINAVVAWLKNYGQRVTEGNIDFERIIPGYTADVIQYSADGGRFLIVRDQFGQYIYTWPESDSITAANTAQIGN